MKYFNLKLIFIGLTGVLSKLNADVYSKERNTEPLGVMIADQIEMSDLPSLETNARLRHVQLAERETNARIRHVKLAERETRARLKHETTHKLIKGTLKLRDILDESQKKQVDCVNWFSSISMLTTYLTNDLPIDTKADLLLSKSRKLCEQMKSKQIFSPEILTTMEIIMDVFPRIFNIVQKYPSKDMRSLSAVTLYTVQR